MVLISGRPNSLTLRQIKIGQKYETLLADWDIPSFVDTLYGLALLISAQNQQGASFLKPHFRFLAIGVRFLWGMIVPLATNGGVHNF